MKTAVLFHNLVKMNCGKQALNISDLRILHHESLAFYGLAGEAQEVLIQCITGVLQPDQGSLCIYGSDSREITESNWFQFIRNFSILNPLTPLLVNSSIGENLAAVFRSRDASVAEAKLSSSVLRLANLVQLTITDLSKIMSEANPLLEMKVRLARAIAFRPKLLILREPSRELPPDVTQQFVRLLKASRRKFPCTMVIFSRDGWLLQELAERVIFLDPETGSIIEKRLRGWYHYVLPFLKPTRAKRLELTRAISKYGIRNSSQV